MAEEGDLELEHSRACAIGCRAFGADLIEHLDVADVLSQSVDCVLAPRVAHAGSKEEPLVRHLDAALRCLALVAQHEVSQTELSLGFEHLLLLFIVQEPLSPDLRVGLEEVLGLDVEGLKFDLLLNLDFLRARLRWLWDRLYNDMLLEVPAHFAYIVQDLFEDLLHVLEAVPEYLILLFVSRCDLL